MKKAPTWIIIISLLALVVVSKFLFFPKEESTKGSQTGKNALAVNYYVIKALPYENSVFYAGKLGALNEVELKPELSGKITNIYFQEGQSVNKGDVLIKINDADFQAQLLKIKTQLKLAIQKLDRLKKLREINGVSEEEYDMQENEIAVLNADEKFYLAQIAKTNIIAPFSGKIGLKNVSEGAFVNSGTALVSLVQLKPLFVEFSVSGKYSQEISKEMDVSFEVERELGNETFSAKVYAIEPKLDEATKTIKVRAFYNGNKELLPGTFVNVTVTFGKKEPKLMCPSQAIIPVLKGHKVIQYKNGIALETPVKIGPRSDQNVLILEGLKVGDTIVTTGLMSIKKESTLTLIQSSN